MNAEKKSHLWQPEMTLTLSQNVEEILNDPEITIVVELMGRIDPAKTLSLVLLEAGKHVVTANKDLLAVHGAELLEMFKKTKCGSLL